MRNANFSREYLIFYGTHFIYTSCSPWNNIYLNLTTTSLREYTTSLTRKDHLGSGNVLLWVGQVDIQGLLLPGDPLVLVGLGVAEPRRLPCFTTDQTPQIGTCIYNVDVMICIVKYWKGEKVYSDKLPCLCFPPCSTVWHWAHALVKIFFPLSADMMNT